MNPNYIDPNRYAQYAQVPQNPGGAPSQFTQFLWNMGQYGVSAISPIAGTALSAAGNILGTWYQNKKQEEFYNDYMSPQARMAQMKAAGINPNAAAEGISGAAAPQMTAASPSSAFTGVGEQLGQSVNSALTANVLRSEAQKNASESNLNNSMNVEKVISNKYLDRERAASLAKLVDEGRITKSQANMIAVDEYYKPASAEASYQQLCQNLLKTGQEIKNLIANTEYQYAAAYQAMASANLSTAEINKVFSDIGVNQATIERISHEVGEIDARTASTYQGIDESKARTVLQEIQGNFQQDYYDIWQNTGFNWNSDVEKSVVGAYSNMDIKNADRMMNGLSVYVRGYGDARSRAKDFTYDKIVDIYGSLARTTVGLGALTIGNNISRVPVFRPKQ